LREPAILSDQLLLGSGYHLETLSAFILSPRFHYLAVYGNSAISWYLSNSVQQNCLNAWCDAFSFVLS